MAWMTFADRARAGWHVDLDQVAQVLYAETFATEERRRSRREVTPGGIYPDVVNVSMNSAGFVGAVRGRTALRFTEFQERMWRSGTEAHRMLVDARMTTVRDSEFLREMQRNASRETSQNIDQAVMWGERAVGGATFLRDASATMLVVGSTLLTGGAAAAVLGAGSVLRGTGKYQDTGNVGAAVLTTSLTFSFGMFPLAVASSPPLTAGERAVMIVVGVLSDTTSAGLIANVQGADVRTAIFGAFVSNGLGHLTNRVGANFINGLSFPARVMTRAAERSARSTAAGAVAALGTGSHQPIPAAGGSLSAACAAQAVRAHSVQFAESYIDLLVMSPYMGDAQPPDAGEFMRALRSMR